MSLPQERAEGCKDGCTFPLIDFDSGNDRTMVCGQEGHGSAVCLLTEARRSWWHVWAGSLPPLEGAPEDEEPLRVHVTLGPTNMGPDHPGMDGKGIPIRERILPFELLGKEDGPVMTYLASFNHEPGDDEIEPLREAAGL